MDNQWLAGFFDGEGCIYLQCDKRKLAVFGLQVSITQNDEPILKEIQSEFGGTVYRHSGRRCYRWRITSAPALSFLKAVQPYVRIKKEQVDLAIEFIKTLRKRNSSGSVPMEDFISDRRFEIHNRLKDLKHNVA